MITGNPNPHLLNIQVNILTKLYPKRKYEALGGGYLVAVTH